MIDFVQIYNAEQAPTVLLEQPREAFEGHFVGRGWTLATPLQQQQWELFREIKPPAELTVGELSLLALKLGVENPAPTSREILEQLGAAAPVEESADTSEESEDDE